MKWEDRVCFVNGCNETHDLREWWTGQVDSAGNRINELICPLHEAQDARLREALEKDPALREKFKTLVEEHEAKVRKTRS